MSDASAFAAVIALWLALGAMAWAWHRRRLAGREAAGADAMAKAAALVNDATAALADVRAGALPPALYFATGARQEALRDDVHALLSRMDAAAPVFDRVAAAQAALSRRLDGQPIAALDEVLHIRRDIWAAADIMLMEDVRPLGLFDSAADERQFRLEAARLAFRTPSPEAGSDDPIDIRLAAASATAAELAARWKADSVAMMARDRLPRGSEIAAALLFLPRAALATAAAMREFGAAVMATARDMRTAGAGSGRAAVAGIGEAVPIMAGSVEQAIARAASRAATSAPALAAHYRFVAAAHAVSRRYASVLAVAPQLSERGREFLKRAELTRAADALRSARADATIRLRRGAVLALAWLIARLQGWAERLAPAAQPSARTDVAVAVTPAAPAPEVKSPAVASLEEVRAMLARALAAPPTVDAGPETEPAANAEALHEPEPEEPSLAPEEAQAAAAMARRFGPQRFSPSPEDMPNVPVTAQTRLADRLAELEPAEAIAPPAPPSAPVSPTPKWLRLFRPD